MDAKMRLKKYIPLKREVENQKERLLRLRTSMLSPSTSALTGLPRSTASDGDKLTTRMTQREALEETIRRQLRKLERETLVIETAIQALEDPTEREVIRLKYVDGLTWEMICIAINYQWTQTHRVHASALANIRF